jgi:hypothetical protein
MAKTNQGLLSTENDLERSGPLGVMGQICSEDNQCIKI